ncbi:Fic family protein [Cohnella terricola]|uniref:Fic family protein n=1 Tax=Cohnella terricola TaxID=1289167 RepID=A0A559JEG9_9BACL|nr:Fic family protein [Cohnella terricola]TVX98257.1 Fic family protein [Cohnella terricola]
MFDSIDQKKQRLDTKRPFPTHTLKSIREHLIVNWTYNSNAIEGNTLTLSETKVVLEGITIGGKTISEHLEALNHREAILYIEEIVKQNHALTEWQIKNIHSLILKGILDDQAGIYRTQNVLISGARHLPPDYSQVPDLMAHFTQWLKEEGANLHPVARAAAVHSEFVKIHPFVDGNGRTARLLLNFELMKNGYPPIVIEKEQRLAYYTALDETHITGDFSKFISFVIPIIDRTLDWYLKLL